MILREEAPGDRATIHSVVEAAFEQKDEADLVDRLRRDDDVVLSLVAMAEEQIIGHIMFCRLDVGDQDGTVPAVGLAPVSVLPDHQRKQVGSTLIKTGIELCRDKSVELILVLGDPAFYQRFGFSLDKAKSLDCAYSGEAFMALELAGGNLDQRPFKVEYPRAFSTL